MDDDKQKQQEKEQYLDDIAIRISGMKMDGKPVDDAKLLGADLLRGAELFGLQEFAPKVQTDILLNLAYFRSDAFKDRVVASLGYDRLDDMSGFHRELDYDRITERAEEAYKNIDFEVEENPILVRMEFDEDGRSVAYFPDGRTPLSKDLEPTYNSLSFVSHELAHYIYNPDDGIYPGSSTYGKSDSPINSITASEINHEKFLDIYENIWKSDEIQEIYDDLPEEDALNILGNLTKARESSKDELLKDKEFLMKMEEHDNLGYERAADIHAASMLMLRDGIWNPFGKEPLTTEKMEEFERRHPNSRIFEYWNREEATRFLNTIAQNGRDNSPTVGQKQNLQQMIRDFDSQKFMGQLSQFASFMSGGEAPEVALSEPKQPAHADSRQVSQGKPLSAETLIAMSAMNYEAEAQSLNESQQVHRSAGYHM